MEWLLIFAAIAVLVPALAWISQDRLIFFPQPLVDTSHLPAHAHRFELRTPDGSRLAGFRLPGETTPSPTLLYFGGNAEEISWALADRRWPRAWSIIGLNYRGYGHSEGKPSERELVADGVLLFDAVAAHEDIDASRIVIVGRSLGTGVAVQVAAQRPAAGVILVSPYDSLVEIGKRHYPYLPVSWLLRHRFDSVSAAPGVKAPLLTLVGTQDGIIAPARSRALHESWAGPGQWVEIDGAGHNDLDASPKYWEAITRFLTALPRRS